MTPLTITAIILGSVILTWLLWVFFLAVMGLERVMDAKGLPIEVKIPGIIALFVGLFIDLIVNLTIASVIFLDPPREKTVTKRLKRYIEGEDGWRKNVAKWFCHRYLDPFDPDGGHCAD